MSNVIYTPLKRKLNTSGNKLTNSNWLDCYLSNLGWTQESIKYLFDPPKENSWRALGGVENLVKILKENIDKGENQLTIIGDYDADGVTSCTILYLILSRIGFDVSYYIPHRIEDGYGMSREIVDKITAMYHETQIIMTCDNGIVALDAVEYAKTLGYKVYITDHHTPNSEIVEDMKEEADVIVHPAFPYFGNESQFRDISGAEVAYKIAQGIMETFSIEDEELSEYLLQLVTISIVSDVMPVASVYEMDRNENRSLLLKGLQSFHDHPNWHFTTLFEMMKIDNKTMDETTIGFYLAPVINAVGRLSSAKTAVDLLTSSKPENIQLFSSVMVFFNEERKKMKAETIRRLNPDTSHSAILVKDKFIHEGIVGIIAGNYCEEFQKPTFVMTECMIDGEKAWKGSARSIAAVNCYELLESIQLDYGCLYKYGGHAGAAGLTVMDEHIEIFENALYEKTDELLKGVTDTIKQYIPLRPSELEDFAKEQNKLKPMGEGLPKPLVGFSSKIISIDFFYSSGHAKVTIMIPTGSKPKYLDIWQYWSLDKIKSDSVFMDGFILDRDNVQKRMETMSAQDAYNGRWEHWCCKGPNEFRFYGYLDYGDLMGQESVIVSTDSIERMS